MLLARARPAAQGPLLCPPGSLPRGPLLLDSPQHLPRLFPLKASEAPAHPVLPGVCRARGEGAGSQRSELHSGRPGGDDPLRSLTRSKGQHAPGVISVRNEAPGCPSAPSVPSSGHTLGRVGALYACGISHRSSAFFMFCPSPGSWGGQGKQLPECSPSASDASPNLPAPG